MSLFKKPKYFLMILLISLSFVPQLGYAGVGEAASATGSWLAEQLGLIIYYVAIKFPSLILLQEIKMFDLVGPYNGFTTQTQVVAAWTTVRDLANMFFILILLIMSFATILGLQGYGYKQLLSKLLLMAILINFSKSFVAILIDFSQIVTLTFLAPVLTSLGANVIVAMGLQDIMNIDTGRANVPEGESYSAISYLMAMILGGIMMIITTVIMGVMLIMFVMRIIGLWIIVILAPLAFLARTFPLMSKYYGQWEGELSKNLTLGPGLAFFMWLAFSIVGNGTVSSEFKPVNPEGGGERFVDDKESFSTAVSKVADTSHMLNFVIAISLLMAGLKFASASGVAGASMAGKASANLQKTGSRIARGATIGAAAGAGMLAWKGSSGDGGIKGGISNVSAIAGKGMVNVGNVLGPVGGGLKRAGLTAQAKDNRRLQRKQTGYNKRFEGMDDMQRLEYNKSVGKLTLGRREAQANVWQDELKTTRGPITKKKAEEMQKAFKASGDIASLEKLGTRSAVVHGKGEQSKKSFERMLALNPDALSNFNITDASQEVMTSIASLAEETLIKGFEGMSKAMRDENMKAINATFDPSSTVKLTGSIDDGNTEIGKARLLQAKYSGKEAQDTGLAADYNRMTEEKKRDFIRRSKMSGEDMLKINHDNDPKNIDSRNMFNDLAFRSSHTQAASMVGAVQAGDTDTLQLIASARTKASGAKQTRVIAGGVLTPYIQDGDVKEYVAREAPTPAVGASKADKDAHTKKLRSMALGDLEHAHVVYPPATNRSSFVAFIEGLTVEQLNEMDRASLLLVKSSCSAATQAKLTSIGVK